MQVNDAQRQIILKVVYDGPPRGGKTTNVHEAHKLLEPTACSPLDELHIGGDTSAYFDFLPPSTASAQGYRLKLKIVDLPGTLSQPSTRRIVLAGVDGMVLVGEATTSRVQALHDHLTKLSQDLRETGVLPSQIPQVLQFNRRSGPGEEAATEVDMAALRAVGKTRDMPTFMANAWRGEGVLETLHGLVATMLAQLEKNGRLSERHGVGSAAFLQQMFAHALPHLFLPR